MHLRLRYLALRQYLAMSSARSRSVSSVRWQQICQHVRCGERADWLNQIDRALSSLSLGPIADNIYSPG